MNNVRYETANPGRLALPGCGTAFLVAMFGLPTIMLVATTWGLRAEHPVALPLAWIGSLFPLAVLWVLRRLMARYALRVFDDGAAQVVLPFKVIELQSDAVRVVRRRVVAAHGPHCQRVGRTWIDLVDADGVALATFAGGAFTDGQLASFVAALGEGRSDLVVEGW